MITLGVLAFQIAHIDKDSPFLVSSDFTRYWASGRLFLRGENPYDPEKLLPLEQKLTPLKAHTSVMYSPPWTLTVLLPFSLMGYQVGRVVWLLLSIFVVLLSADGLWRFYGGPARYRWLAPLIAFSFPPTLHMLLSGQIGSFLLLGRSASCTSRSAGTMCWQALPGPHGV